MRYSGVLLVGLALGHLWLMHIRHSVEDINYDFVVRRLGDTFSVWRWYDLALLTLAMIHGMNGVRILIDDYLHVQPWRGLARFLLFVGGGAIIILGAIVLLTFHPHLRVSA